MAPRAALSSYPHPSVAVDVALLTVDLDSAESRLLVLVQEREDPDGIALPGRFLREGRTIADAVSEALRGKVHVEAPAGRVPRLLRIFDEPGRDDRGWTISAAHSLSMPYDVLADADGRLVPIRADGRLPQGEHLLFDHDEIVREAVADLRRRYEISNRFTAAPDPDRFVSEPFTLSDIRRVHEAVLGERIQKDNFTRRVLDQLRPVIQRGEHAVRREGRGRPAPLYRHRNRPEGR